MCNGNIKCKTCTRLGSRKKKTMRKLKIQDIVVNGAGVAAGIAAGKAVTSNLPFTKNSPIASAGIQIAIALIISRSKGNIVKSVAAGMTANGVVDIAKGLLGSDFTQQIGLSGLGSGHLSTLNPGVAGLGIRNKMSIPNIKY